MSDKAAYQAKRISRFLNEFVSFWSFRSFILSVYRKQSTGRTMSGRVAVLLFFAVTFYTEFPYASAYRWIDFPVSEIKIVYPNVKTANMTWIWSLDKNSQKTEQLSEVEIKRYKEGKKDTTEKTIATFYAINGNVDIHEKNSQSSLTVTKGVAGGANGKAVFIINEVKTSQGTNEDGSNVDVMTANYVYSCVLSLATEITDPGAKSTKLIVYKKPSFKITPRSIETTLDSISLECTAEGKPEPTISWEIKETSGDHSSDTKTKLTLKPINDAGVYNCTAKSDAGSVSAVAVVQYTGCDSTCSTDDGIGIEMTGLTYNSNYQNPNSEEYKNLKKKIEQECLNAYATYLPNQEIYSCIVLSFRSGSVVANVKITYPSKVSNPRKPLEEAIKTGTFAGQAVKKSFVSPTKAPTESTQPTESTVASPSDGPDSGKRADGEGGLSTGAVVAIVVVFSIIFIVIIIVVVVCLLKRKKPAPKKSYDYKEDGKNQPAASPLKSQPYRDPGYDNGPDKPKEVVYADLHFQDRYPNGGGPPPQYTAADYAEVRPSPPNRNDSQMEWDKDVDEKNEMWI